MVRAHNRTSSRRCPPAFDNFTRSTLRAPPDDAPDGGGACSLAGAVAASRVREQRWPPASSSLADAAACAHASLTQGRVLQGDVQGQRRGGRSCAAARMCVRAVRSFATRLTHTRRSRWPAQLLHRHLFPGAARQRVAPAPHPQRRGVALLRGRAADGVRA